MYREVILTERRGSEPFHVKVPENITTRDIRRPLYGVRSPSNQNIHVHSPNSVRESERNLSPTDWERVHIEPRPSLILLHPPVTTCTSTKTPRRHTDYSVPESISGDVGEERD